LVAAAKFLYAATKKIFVVPNFVAATKPFFPCFLFLPSFLFLTPCLLFYCLFSFFSWDGAPNLRWLQNPHPFQFPLLTPVFSVGGNNWKFHRKNAFKLHQQFSKLMLNNQTALFVVENSKFESMRVADMWDSVKIPRISVIPKSLGKKELCCTDWNLVNFHRISETRTDSNPECKFNIIK